ncbi:MAG: NADH-quinone oxidoreductase subunit [Actinomycetota bacterium]|nr:NADH-quinone oxidoreductase subunit [Actinomycetota bacterium]
MSSADVETETPEADAAPAEGPANLLQELTEALGDAVVGSHTQGEDLTVRVDAGSWHQAAEACKALGFDYFCFLSGLDWMPSTSPNPRASVSDELDTGDDEAPAADDDADDDVPSVDSDADAEAAATADGWQTGVAGGDTRFQIFARLYSTTRHQGVTLKADLDDDDPRVPTWSDVYPGANWTERETWEMYGFVFDGHPHLVKLYLPGEFEGFPLRKDFPLLSREVKPWPGLVDVEPMPEVPESDAPAEPAAPAAEAPAEPAAPAAEAPAAEAPAAEAPAADEGAG